MLDFVVVVVSLVEDVAGLPVADVTESVVAGPAELLHDTRSIAATTAPLLADELLR